MGVDSPGRQLTATPNGSDMHQFNKIAASVLLLAACGGARQFGKVELGDLTVEGSVQAEYLYLQLDQLDPTFEACYVQALRRDRSAEGMIEMSLAGRAGHLHPTITKNGTGSEDLATCVENAVTQLTIVEPDNYEPWDFTGDWSVSFQIVRRE